MSTTWLSRAVLASILAGPAISVASETASALPPITGVVEIDRSTAAVDAAIELANMQAAEATAIRLARIDSGQPAAIVGESSLGARIILEPFLTDARRSLAARVVAAADLARGDAAWRMPPALSAEIADHLLGLSEPAPDLIQTVLWDARIRHAWIDAPPLREALASMLDRPDTASMALMVLAVAGDPGIPGVEDRIHALRLDPDHPAHGAAVAHPLPLQPEFIDALLERIDAGSVEPAAAIHWLHRCIRDPAPGARDRLLEHIPRLMVSGPPPFHRDAALVRFLAEHGDARAVPALLRASESRSGSPHAAFGLARLDPELARDVVIARLDDAAEPLRRETFAMAAWAGRGSGDPALLAALRRSLGIDPPDAPAPEAGPLPDADDGPAPPPRAGPQHVGWAATAAAMISGPDARALIAQILDDPAHDASLDVTPILLAALGPTIGDLRAEAEAFGWARLDSGAISSRSRRGFHVWPEASVVWGSGPHRILAEYGRFTSIRRQSREARPHRPAFTALTTLPGLDLPATAFSETLVDPKAPLGGSIISFVANDSVYRLRTPAVRSLSVGYRVDLIAEALNLAAAEAGSPRSIRMIGDSNYAALTHKEAAWIESTLRLPVDEIPRIPADATALLGAPPPGGEAWARDATQAARSAAERTYLRKALLAFDDADLAAAARQTERGAPAGG